MGTDFVGVWDVWRDPGGQRIKSCSILTTTPNAATSLVHDRVPIIVDRSDYDLWVDPGMTQVDEVRHLLKPYQAVHMCSCPGDSKVNQAANDDEVCSIPVDNDRGAGPSALMCERRTDPDVSLWGALRSGM